MTRKKPFNLRGRLKKYRFSGILILVTLFPILAIAETGDFQSPTDKELVEVLEKAAKIYNADVQLYFFSEYKINRNGLRFPSTYYVREQYSGKRFSLEGRLNPENKILRSEVKVKYQDYKFFDSETETPAQSRPIQTAEKENPPHTFPQISLRLITGGSYLSMGDINHGIDGFFRYLNTQGFVDVTSPAPGALHY